MMRYYGYNVGGGAPTPRESEIVQVGDAHGRIAVYLGEQSARDLAALYGPSDAAHDELVWAIGQAYPAESEAQA